MKELSGSTEDKSFWIGRVGDTDYWTNVALAHETGQLTNAKLLAMSNEQLDVLWKHGEAVIFEDYRYPNDKKLADKQGGAPNRIYMGVHRAKVILDYRDAKRKQELGQLEIEEQAALQALIYPPKEKQPREIEPDWCEKHKGFLIDCSCFKEIKDEVPY